MKYIKTFEEEINPVEFVPNKREHPSYKTEVKKKKKDRKIGEIAPVEVIPNHAKDVIGMRPTY